MEFFRLQKEPELLTWALFYILIDYIFSIVWKKQNPIDAFSHSAYRGFFYLLITSTLLFINALRQLFFTYTLS